MHKDPSITAQTAGSKEVELPVFRKLIAGDPYRKTRLHDEKGNRMPLEELGHLPLNAYLWARRRLTGYLPDGPWIPFNARKRLEVLLDPSWRMIEFGSGMSTPWYARRMAHVHSIENNPKWFARISQLIPSNVKYELRNVADFPDLDDYEDETIDFAVIDGAARGPCMEAVIPKIRKGGWIYLDNSDKDMIIPNGDVRQAEQRLRDAVAYHDGQLEEGTGLPTGLLAATQWQLARL